MQNKFELAVILLLVVLGCFAQENKITGKILDLETKEPLPGIVMRNNKNSVISLSNGEGEYNLMTAKLNPDDSLFIEGMCYERLCFTLKRLMESPAIYLKQKTYAIAEIEIMSEIDWEKFIRKVYGNIEANKPYPFEMEFKKNIRVERNGENVNENIFEGNAHYEGLDLKNFIRSNKNQFNIWYMVNKFNVSKNKFIHFADDKAPYVLFNQLETGMYIWGLVPDIRYFNFSFQEASSYGNDSVIVVKMTMKDKPFKIRILKSYDRFNFYKPLALFQAERFLYIRKKDLKIMQLKFILTDCQKNENTTLVSSVEKVEGAIGIEYIDKSICPLFYDVSYYYNGTDGKKYVYTEKTYMNNIQKLKLSDEELKSKYGVIQFNNKYPGRFAVQDKRVIGLFEIPYTK